MIERLLFKLTKNLPCRLIHRKGGQPYLERYYIGRLFGVTAYLHRFVDRDADEWVHDHPWRLAVAICLAGWYIEERVRWFEPSGWGFYIRTIFPGRPNIIRGSDFHRIHGTRPETWTLFLHGERVKGWGFLCRQSVKGIGLALMYYQPYDVSKSSRWETRAPKGGNAGRQPLRAATRPKQ